MQNIKFNTMRKLFLFISFFLLILSANARFVNIETAETIAKNIYYESASEYYTLNYDQIQVLLYKEMQTEKNTLYYIFNMDSEVDGYVIVSADDAVYPVLGYSFNGMYNNEYESPSIKNVLENYAKEISFAITNNLPPDENIRDEWERLMRQSVARGTRSVSPLVAATWDQGLYYNRNCPYDAASSYDSRALVGCVAVAMGQVMHYYKHPTTGNGSSSYYHSSYGTLSANYGMTTYSWSGMPNKLTSHNSAVATLLYHCGVSVEMNYGISGSGAYTADAENALKNYFGYASTTDYLEKSNYANSTWEGMMKTEIDNSRPIIYKGYGSSGGHAFVCDGYQGTSNNYFHFNWGWSGYLNGYFYLSSLNPGTYDFTTSQGAVMGIKPATVSNVMITLIDAMDPDPDTYVQYEEASVWIQLGNLSTTDFTGDYRASLYSTSGQFVEMIDTFNNRSLQKGYYYTNGMTFYKSSITATPGNYLLVVEFKPSGGSWTLVDEDTYQNPMTITVKSGTSSYDIRLYAAIDVDPDPMIKGDSVTVWLDLANYSSTTFYGDFDVSIFEASSGKFVETIATKTGYSMPTMTHFSNGLTFKSEKIAANPGQYLLAVHYMPTGENWTLVNEGTYTNPIQIEIKDKALQADPYESNESEGTAHQFSLSFSGDSATVKTTGSNFHSTSDADFFKIDLAAGYNYTISSNLYDLYNSYSTNTYTLDALYAYKYGSNWSAYFEDDEANDFQATNGGVIYFEVAPYFSGTMGTYLLEIKVKRQLAGKADLTVINGAASKTNLFSGEKLTASCDVQNTGGTSSGSSVLKYYLSANTTYESGDLEAGADNVLSLAYNGTQTVAEEITIPSSTAAGDWYILFYADANGSVDESDENNNVAYKKITVEKGEADLIVSASTISPSSVERGKNIDVTCTVKNQGNIKVNASVVKYFISANTSLDGADMELGMDNVVSLEAAQTNVSNNSLLIPSNTPEGNWYIIFKADATDIITESDENNNIAYKMIAVTKTSSINNPEEISKQLVVYPNPSKGKFYCHLTFTEVRTANYILFDMSGKEIQSGSIQNGLNYVDFEDAEKGIYMMQISNGHELIYCKVVIE